MLSCYSRWHCLVSLQYAVLCYIMVPIHYTVLLNHVLLSTTLSIHCSVLLHCIMLSRYITLYFRISLHFHIVHVHLRGLVSLFWIGRILFRWRLCSEQTTRSRVWRNPEHSWRWVNEQWNAVIRSSRVRLQLSSRHNYWAAAKSLDLRTPTWHLWRPHVRGSYHFFDGHLFNLCEVVEMY